MKNLNRSLAVGLVAATLLLAGCSDDAATPPQAAPSETASASESASPSESASASETATSVPTPTLTADPETGKYEWCDPAQQEPFTGPASEKFGAEEVMDAYCTMVDLQMENSFVDSLLRKESGFTKQDFDVVREYLGPEARKDWDADVAQIVKGTANEATFTDVVALVGHNISNGSPYTLDKPAVFNQRFSPATTSVDDSTGRPRLVLTFTVGADYALLRDSDDKEMAASIDREVTFWLVRNEQGANKWIIDGYRMSQDIVPPTAREKIIKPSS